jgi:anaerobic ribonucleoside-triphosphate reductase
MNSKMDNMKADNMDQPRQRCEVWTRVMGYHRPVDSFNTGKKGEHSQRKYFNEAKSK